MHKGRFVLFLSLLFALSFWWAGGGAMLNKLSPPKIALPSPPALAAPVAAETKASGWQGRLYRIVYLKNAVQSQLDTSRYVRLNDTPLIFQQAIIAVEDNRFYSHHGIDIEGILRAMLVNMQTGEFVQGASTITQQLVKNLLLSQEQTAERKFEEAILAVDMEFNYSKEQILEMYINTIYFGSGAYGMQDAAKIYFNKKPADLNLAECALLAGLPNAPSILSPYVDFSAAKRRQAVVLSTMVKNNFIGPAAAEEAKLSPIKLAK